MCSVTGLRFWKPRRGDEEEDEGGGGEGWEACGGCDGCCGRVASPKESADGLVLMDRRGTGNMLESRLGRGDMGPAGTSLLGQPLELCGGAMSRSSMVRASRSSREASEHEDTMPLSIVGATCEPFRDEDEEALALCGPLLPDVEARSDGHLDPESAEAKEPARLAPSAKDPARLTSLLLRASRKKGTSAELQRLATLPALELVRVAWPPAPPRCDWVMVVWQGWGPNDRSRGSGCECAECPTGYGCGWAICLDAYMLVPRRAKATDTRTATSLRVHSVL